MPEFRSLQTIATMVLLASTTLLLFPRASAADKPSTDARPFAVELCNITRDPLSNPFFCNGFASSSGDAAIPAGTRFTIERIAGVCAGGIREIGGRFNGRDIYYPFTGGGSITEPFSVETLMFIDSNAPLGPGGWDVLAQSNDGNCRVILTGYLTVLPK